MNEKCITNKKNTFAEPFKPNKTDRNWSIDTKRIFRTERTAKKIGTHKKYEKITKNERYKSIKVL